jgi:hypothetical protein
MSKKSMSPNEKQAKLSVLKDLHKQSSDLMSQSLKVTKDSPELKKSVKRRSDESGIDFKGDSDKIHDPRKEGDVIGDHISDENDVIEPNSEMSVYDIDEELARLMKLRDSKRG